jgi:hypothetical protein
MRRTIATAAAGLVLGATLVVTQGGVALADSSYTVTRTVSCGGSSVTLTGFFKIRSSDGKYQGYRGGFAVNNGPVRGNRIYVLEQYNGVSTSSGIADFNPPVSAGSQYVPNPAYAAKSTVSVVVQVRYGSNQVCQAAIPA